MSKPNFYFRKLKWSCHGTQSIQKRKWDSCLIALSPLTNWIHASGLCNSGENQSPISNFNNKKHNTHKWDAGEVGSGSGQSREPNSSLSHYENHLDTHLSLNQNRFWWPSNQNQNQVNAETLQKPHLLHLIYFPSLPPPNTHTHTSLTPRPLSKLSTVGSLTKACLVFLNCKHETGREARGKHSQNRGKSGPGWNHAFQDTKSNLEIFFWPRVKRMILLWGESLDDALHDRKEKKWKRWVRGEKMR